MSEGSLREGSLGKESLGKESLESTPDQSLAPASVSKQALQRTLHRAFWSLYGGTLRTIHHTYGAAFRALVRPHRGSIVSYGRVLRFVRYAHHFDSFGHRVAMGTGVKFWGPIKVHVGDDVAMFDRVHVVGQGELHMDDRASLGHDTVVVAHSVMRIGKHVQVAAHCYLIDLDHEFVDPNTPIKDQGLRVAPITIEDDAWIGAHSIILRGVTIGRGAIVGANSVVTKSVPPYSIAAGNPARVIRQRGPGDTPPREPHLVAGGE